MEINLSKESIEKLVVIDDDEIHNFIAKKLLDKLQVADRIEIINSPTKAIQFFEDTCLKKVEGICPELVLLDYMFPDMNAIDLMNEVNKRGVVFYRHIIVFVISSLQIREEDKNRLKALGVNGFLSKPIKEIDILRVLEIYCQEKNIKLE